MNDLSEIYSLPAEIFIDDVNQCIEAFQKRLNTQRSLSEIANNIKFHGYQVKMIDMLVDATSASDLKAIIEKYMPDVIGISASYTDSINTTYKITKYLRKLSNAILIAGGVHVTFNPEEALKNGFDYVIKNEGESTLIELLEYLKAESGYFRNIRGLVYKKDGNPFKNPPRDFITGLDTLLSRFIKLQLNTICYPLSIIASRGCPGTVFIVLRELCPEKIE